LCHNLFRKRTIPIPILAAVLPVVVVVVVFVVFVVVIVVVAVVEVSLKLFPKTPYALPIAPPGIGGYVIECYRLGIIWVCLKIGYIPDYSHLIGIMIINHWVNGVFSIFRHTHIGNSP